MKLTKVQKKTQVQKKKTQVWVGARAPSVSRRCSGDGRARARDSCPIERAPVLLPCPVERRPCASRPRGCSGARARDSSPAERAPVLVPCPVERRGQAPTMREPVRGQAPTMLGRRAAHPSSGRPCAPVWGFLQVDGRC